jgi:hypothetical protein
VCRQLALDNLGDISAYVTVSQDHQRGSAWYTVFFAMQASLPVLLSLVWEASHPDAAVWREAILDTARWFHETTSMSTVSQSYMLPAIMG